MTIQNLAVWLIVISLVFCGFVYSQPFEMTEINEWMWMRNADGTGEIRKLFKIPKYAIHFHWLDSSVFMFQDTGGIATISLDAKRSVIAKTMREKTAPFHISNPIFLPDGTVGYYELPPWKHIWETEKRVFRVIKQGKLSPDLSLKQKVALEHARYVPQDIDEGIWLESVDGSMKKMISSYKYYSFPVLSPDGTKILVECNAKCDKQIVCVLNLEGHETCVGKESINPLDPHDTTFIRGCVDGIPIWSPDGVQIAYAYERYRSVSEHNVQIVGSELYVESPDGTNRRQITVPDGAPTGPVWSPDGSRIACTDRFTSKIYVIKLK
jgi:Tol biopolymer transport system component